MSAKSGSKTFVLKRHTDVSGVSGTGIVADGILWPDGMCTIHWRGQWPTDNTHLSIESVIHIHCHGGMTSIVYDDEEHDETIAFFVEPTFNELIGLKKKGRSHAE